MDLVERWLVEHASWLRWVAHALGLVPVLAVAWVRPKARAWWWLAAAFGVSFLADTASLFVGHPLISQTYPLLQAGLFALVLAPRPLAIAVIAVLACVSGLSLALRDAKGLDVALHLAAWGSTAMLARETLQDGALRTTLVWGFSLLALAWLGFTLEPSMLTWGVMQAVRLGMALGFVYAVRTAHAAD